MAKVPSMNLKAIGIVRNEIRQPIRHGWGEIVSDIVVSSDLTEALDGLDEFSHIIVLYWMHQLPAKQLSLKVHPMGRPELPLTGRFATRSPSRPNPVGLATVRLMERKGNILRVKGLDATNGTPVIDIKPYLPKYDSATDAKAPPWTTEH